jgi:hypothetical protein
LEAVERSRAMNFDAERLRLHARQFDTSVFRERITFTAGRPAPSSALSQGSRPELAERNSDRRQSGRAASRANAPGGKGIRGIRYWRMASPPWSAWRCSGYWRRSLWMWLSLCCYWRGVRAHCLCGSGESRAAVIDRCARLRE